jgi:hypothetical protein
VTRFSSRQRSTDDVPIRDYVDMLFAEKEKALQAALLAQEKAVNAALQSSDKAIDKAEANAEKWRASANEWRGAMSDRDRELPSRREVDTAMDGLSERLRIVEQRVEKAKDHSEGKSAGVGLIGAVVVGSVTVAVLVISAVVAVANAATG